VRKNHNLWDRTKRSWKATLAQSEVNPNTQHGKIEKDLTALVDNASSIDGQLCSLETIFLRGMNYSCEEIKNVAQLCGDINIMIKDGNKKQAALKSAFAA
jgi:hypothetical protein